MNLLFLVLTLGVFQDDCCKDKCGMASLCPMKGDCKDKCREICDSLGVTLKTVRAKVGELMKEEVGVECDCTVGKCTTSDCGRCQAVCTNVVGPIVKAKVEAHLKTPAKHDKADCTFLSKTTCATCVDELAASIWKGLKKALKIDEIGEAVKTRIMEKMKKEGVSCDCACAKGEVSVDKCKDCAPFKTKVFGPMLKAKFDAHKPDAKHGDATCTFMTDTMCGTCMDELADAIWLKIKELKSKK
jgi:hypothetical protein